MSLDFTFNKYQELCKAIIKSGYIVLTVAEYLTAPNPKATYIVIRHDVDRRPNNAIRIAELEKNLGIKTTYFFRINSLVTVPDLIKEIAAMGHEIGYHYETLDKARGDYKKAIQLFEDELKSLREICEVRTICMHGNPLTRWNNLDLWSKYDFKDFGLLGEPYLSLGNMPYFSDTGRTWADTNKLKDSLPQPNNGDEKKSGSIVAHSTDDVIELIKKERLSSAQVSMHPERWSYNLTGWIINLARDTATNIAKRVIKRRGPTTPKISGSDLIEPVNRGGSASHNMRILIDISHPADVHFFKHFIWIMKEKGYQIFITAKDKDVAIRLLDAYGFPHQKVGQYQKGTWAKAADMLKIDYRIYKAATRFKPDIFISFGSPNAAHVSTALCKPHIAFDDTDHAVKEKLLYYPFTSVVVTPSTFRRNYGRKQVRFEGYKELAYLHPNYFKPDPSVLGKLGINKSDRFIIVRFVAWEASHDVGQHGFSLRGKIELVSELEKYGRVLITSEKPLPEMLERYRISVPPEKLHDLLYFATLCIGEGATVASECAVLGTPAIYVNTLRLGYLDEQEERYGLVYNFSNPQTAEMQGMEKALELLMQPDLKDRWAEKRQRLLGDKIDVTQFMVDFIENYPESFAKYKEGSKNQK